jgi:diketogulonate reductase-like aldo/keto reductase
MYNRSERVIGEILRRGNLRSECFLATKVWTDGEDAGRQQMRRSAELMDSEIIDLMQVHNRRDLATHWPVIREMQQEGYIRYNGITDYRASAIDSLMQIMRRDRPDFLQINYSLGERDADRTLLPLAEELGIAVLVNRPFVAGRLFRAVGDRPLPDWARDFADSWGQFFLKFIVSHPAVTCVIPATSKLHHQIDNLGAGAGELPDQSTRQRMIRLIESV